MFLSTRSVAWVDGLRILPALSFARAALLRVFGIMSSTLDISNLGSEQLSSQEHLACVYVGFASSQLPVHHGILISRAFFVLLLILGLWFL